MAETSGNYSGRQQRLKTTAFILGWTAAVAALALFMRVWISELDIMEELASLEEEDTEQVDPNRALPATLQPQTGIAPAFSASGTVYVPVYSSLYVGGARSLNKLSTTLALRNRSTGTALVITALEYFDANGKAVKDLLEVPHVLAPMATAELYIDQGSVGDQAIAAIVVEWGAESPIPAPTIQAVIVGSYGAKSISFISRGESIDE